MKGKWYNKGKDSYSNGCSLLKLKAPNWIDDLK